jgi:hypothetical protein
MSAETKAKLISELTAMHCHEILKVVDGMYDGYKAGVGVNDLQFSTLKNVINTEIQKLIDQATGLNCL